MISSTRLRLGSSPTETPSLSASATTPSVKEAPSPPQDFKVNTPPYKTYPFVLGMSGVALGLLGSSVSTILQPQEYSKTHADGTKERLKVVYNQSGKKPLKEALYEKWKDESIPNGTGGGMKQIRRFQEGSGSFQYNPHIGTYQAVYPIPIADPKYTSDIKDYETEVVHVPSVEREMLIRKHHFPQHLNIQDWMERPLLEAEKKNAPEGLTHQVDIILDKPMSLANHSAPSASLRIYHGGEGSRSAHVFQEGGASLKVALNEAGHIAEADLPALNGLPVLVLHPMKNMKPVVQDIPAYIKTLENSLDLQPKSWLNRLVLAAALFGGVGYAVGWGLDLKKRHDRKQKLAPPKPESNLPTKKT
jgi:hypothetical protein